MSPADGFWLPRHPFASPLPTTSIKRVARAGVENRDETIAPSVWLDVFAPLGRLVIIEMGLSGRRPFGAATRRCQEKPGSKHGGRGGGGDNETT